MRNMDLVHSVAAGQLNLVALGQLTGEGVPDRTIRRWVALGVLRPAIPGRVYSLGGVMTEDRRLLAVCLGFPLSWVSGVSAAEHWQLRRLAKRYLEVTVPAGTNHHIAGVRVRRTSNASTDIVSIPTGLRLSSVAQTLFEVAGILDDETFGSVLDDALNRSLVTRDELRAYGRGALAQGRGGSFRFRRAIGALDPNHVPVMSDDEHVLLAALEAAGVEIVRQYPLRLPDRRTIYFDGAVVACRLAVEVDGGLHDINGKPASDKVRDLQAAAVGWVVVRVPTAQVRDHLPATVALILATLRRRALPDAS